MKFQFTEGMNEVSGLGGAHERALRTGVIAGARWFAEHEGATPLFREGDIPCNTDAVSLLDAVNFAEFVGDDGTKEPLTNVLTSFARYAILYHATWIGQHGWENYVRAMSSPFNFYNDTVEPQSETQ